MITEKIWIKTIDSRQRNVEIIDFIDLRINIMCSNQSRPENSKLQNIIWSEQKIRIKNVVSRHQTVVRKLIMISEFEDGVVIFFEKKYHRIRVQTGPLKEGCPAITKISQKCWFHKVNSKFQITLKTSEMMYLDPRNILSNFGRNRNLEKKYYFFEILL